MPVPVIAPVMGGASKLVPPLMQNPYVAGAAGMVAGGLARPVMDTMGRVIDYGAGAPVNMGTAKERGLAGVLGGTIDNITGGMTDLDKRGDSKKQKDVKKFLNKFIYGTGEQMRQANPAGAMPGFEFPDSKTYTPGKSQFGGFS